MNKERILELAKVIEAQPHTPIDADSGFNMARIVHDCGTPACICGWANHLRFNGAAKGDALTSYEWAADWLGIIYPLALALFEPDEAGLSDENWHTITPAHAAAVLRHLAETGDVDWSVQP